MNRIQELLIFNLKRNRKRLGFSQERLAEICDLSQSFVAAIEVGRKFPSAETLLKLTNALDVKPYELLIEQDESLDIDKQKRLETLISELQEKVVREFRDMLEELK